MANEINYSRLLRRLDEWERHGGLPKTKEELTSDGWDMHEIWLCEYCGSVLLEPDDGLYHLINRELIGPMLGNDMTRAERIVSDLMATMRGNRANSKRIERTCLVSSVDPEKVPAIREWARQQFGDLLVELDEKLMAAYKEGGVRVGATVFQFDALD